MRFVLFAIFKKAVLFFLIVTSLWVIIYRFVNPPITWLMIQRSQERKEMGKEQKIDYRWRDREQISKNLRRAVIAAEDQRFMSHYGFDLGAIRDAIEQNLQSDKLRGGSTISQQTAKNVFLWPGRSWIRKGLETYFTVLIEIFWSKERILEVYLNVIEMGDGIYGAEAASKAYFGISARKLTKAQAALIAAVLPNPLRWSPAHPTAYILRKQALIIRLMNKRRWIYKNSN